MQDEISETKLKQQLQAHLPGSKPHGTLDLGLSKYAWDCQGLPIH